MLYLHYYLHISTGKFAAKIGPEEFGDVLQLFGGDEAVSDWKKIIDRLTGPDGFININI